MANDDCEVDARLLNGIGKGSVAFNEEFDLHARKQRSELRQYRRQDCGKVLRTADADIAGDAIGVNGVEQLVMNGENAARIGERYFSSFSEYETAAALAKDCHSEVILQAFHLKTDGGRSTAKTVGGLRQAAQVVGHDESAQGIQIEVCARRHECCVGSVRDWNSLDAKLHLLSMSGNDRRGLVPLSTCMGNTSAG